MKSKNIVETTEKRKVKPPTNGVKFTSEYQPTPEQKSKGWNKRNKWIAEIDEVMEQMIKIQDPFTKTVKNQKMIDALKRRYAAALLSMKPQIFIDWLNRKFGKPDENIKIEADITETQTINCNVSVDWVISLISDVKDRNRIQLMVLKEQFGDRVPYKIT